MVAVVVLLGGCGEREVFAPQDVDVLVVDAVLVVDQSLPRVRLSRTQGRDGVYSATASGEPGASVTIRQGTTVATYQYSGTAGYYLPLTDLGPVLPGTTYELRIESRRGELLTARTTTPRRFRVDEWLVLDDTAQSVERTLATYSEVGDEVFDRNQVVYTEGLLEARFTQDLNRYGYQLTLAALDATDYVIDTSGLSQEDLDDLDPVIASPIFGAEGKFFRLPWFAVFYAGRYVIRAWSLDANWRDLVTSIPELDDGGGNFGGNIGDGVERPDFNVEGGIGLFGSASVDSVGLTILPRGS